MYCYCFVIIHIFLKNEFIFIVLLAFCSLSTLCRIELSLSKNSFLVIYWDLDPLFLISFCHLFCSHLNSSSAFFYLPQTAVIYLFIYGSC